MKNTTRLYFILISIISIACESNVTNPIGYIENNANALTRDTESIAQLSSDLPSGTIIGDGYSSYTAYGNEQLTEGNWVSNNEGTAYEIHIHSSAIAGLNYTAEISVINPIQTQYRTISSIWMTLSSNITVMADSIRTGWNGGCDIETDEELSIGGSSGTNF